MWNQFLVWPILNVLIAFYKAFEWLHLPGPMGFAVIALTVFIRLLLYPLMMSQLKSTKKMSKIKPHMDALAAKHKGDKQGLQQAQLALYKEHGVNPAAGCLPLLVQMPILFALYNVFFQVLGNGNLEKVVSDINTILYSPALRLTSLDLSFFGINLAIKPSQWQTHGWWLLSVPVITGLLQYWQTKLMMPADTSVKHQVSSIKQKQAVEKKGEQKDEKKEEKPQDTAGEIQKQMAIMTPLMFGFFALQFPLGLALYWNVFGIFGIIQQIKVNKEA